MLYFCKSVQRRTLLKSIGVASMGIGGISGTGLARESRDRSDGVSSGRGEEYDPNDTPIDVDVDRIETDDGVLTVSLAEHEETGEQFAVATSIPETQVSAQSSGETSLPSGGSGLQSVSPEAAEELLQERKSDTVGSQRTYTILDEVWERLPTHQEDWVVDASAFLNRDCCSSPDYLGTNPDYHFGASVELTDMAIDVGSVALGAIVGAILMAGAGTFVAPVLGTLAGKVLGGVAGGIAGYAIQNFKRSNYISVSARDTVLSQWIPGTGTVSVAATNLSVSGRWEDQRESRMPTFGYLLDHQEAIVDSTRSNITVHTGPTSVVREVI